MRAGAVVVDAPARAGRRRDARKRRTRTRRTVAGAPAKSCEPRRRASSLLRRLSGRERRAVSVPAAARHRRRHDRRNDVRRFRFNAKIDPKEFELSEVTRSGAGLAASTRGVPCPRSLAVLFKVHDTGSAPCSSEPRFATAAAAQAQPARDGRLIVTVVDPTGAVIPARRSRCVGLEDATQGRDRAAGQDRDKARDDRQARAGPLHRPGASSPGSSSG